MKAIAFFNNKGGVGKTTTLCNLAAHLALHKKYKVLVIDADPQCNATQLAFDDEETTRIYEDNKSFTLYSVIHPLSLGQGYSKDVEVTKRAKFGFDILVGDPRIALKEDLLARDWSQALGSDVRGLRTSYVFAQLVGRLKHYDYVFFDVGPSLGAINRSVLLACDYFVSPMTIDIFSLRAIENIQISIRKWKKDLRIALDNLEESDELPSDMPEEFEIKFAGYVTQQYKAKSDGEGKLVAVDAFERISRKVNSVIKQNFVDKLQPSFHKVNYQLGTIPNLHSLIPLAQFARKPIFELKSADGVRGAHFSRVRVAGELFEQISERFIENLEALDDDDRLA